MIRVAMVNSTASTLLTLASKSCSLKSGEVSIKITKSLISNKIEHLRRLFFGLFGLQLPQLFPKLGTPIDEPHPKIVT